LYIYTSGEACIKEKENKDPQMNSNIEEIIEHEADRFTVKKS
jgi:hypothetical protein